MQQTTRYKFNLIETSDAFSPEALNANAKAVETELARVEAAVASNKASADAAITDNKANADAAIAAIRAGLGSTGHNARVVWGTYTGNGQNGPAHPTSLKPGFFPVCVMVGEPSSYSRAGWPTTMIRPAPYTATPYSYAFKVSWTDDAVSWYNNAGGSQHNDAGTTYYYVAFGYDLTK